MTLLSVVLLFSRIGSSQQVQCVEYPRSSDSVVSVQAIIRLGAMSPVEEAEARVLCETFRKGTEEYSGEQVLSYGAQGGAPVRFTFMPDHIRISILMPSGGLGVGLDLISALIQRPRLPDDAIRTEIEVIERESPDIWTLAKFPYRLTVKGITPTKVRNFAKYVLRPENIVICIGGAIQPGEGESSVRSHFSQWKLGIPGNKQDSQGEIIRIDTSKFRPAIYNFIAKDESPEPRSVLTKLVALTQIGFGKQSSLFRIVREKLGISYQQDAFLWPSPTGFKARFIFFTTQKVSEADIRTALLGDINIWTESDLERARRLLIASFEGAIPFGPMWITRTGQPSNSLEDQTFLRGYWLMKFGQTYSLETNTSEIEKVTLPSIKKIAADIVTNSKLTMTVGD